MSEITSVDLSKEGFREIPFSMISKDVNWLILSDNRINKITDEIGKLKNLTRLAINDNCIDIIEKNICMCTKMTWIDLTRNKLKNLPKEMGNLDKISGLGLSENEFENIPECIYKLKNLRKFGFFSNKISIIPPSIKYLKSLVKVDLSNNKLIEIPDELCTLYNINWLNLSNNRLRTLPKNIGKLTKLEELGLGVNQLIEIPDMSNLKKLRILPIFKNKLKYVHPSVFKLKRLEKLDLSDNFLEEFPIELLYNPSMRYLNIRGNLIKRIKPELFNGTLSTIGIIDISDNEFEYLPYKFFKSFLESTTVRLNGNKFKKKNNTFPINQSLMDICVSKILSTGNKMDSWLTNMFENINVCDNCNATFIVKPCFVYIESNLDSENKFVIEKMCCSAKCLRLAMKC